MAKQGLIQQIITQANVFLRKTDANLMVKALNDVLNFKVCQFWCCHSFCVIGIDIGNMHIICEFDTSLLTYDDKVNE